MDRITSGIPGLDKLIEGGLPKGSITLVSGAPGTGKTIMGMQFLEAGLKKGEKCVYVSIEEEPDDVLAQAYQFGFFKKPPEIISANDIKYDIGAKKPEDIEERINLTLEKLQAIKPNRVLIDSVSSLQIEDGISARRVTRRVISGLKSLGATSILTGEALDGDYPDKLTPFLVDGLIIMHYSSIGRKLFGNLEVRKMRLTKHLHGIYDYVMDKGGIRVIEDKGKSVMMK